MIEIEEDILNRSTIPERERVFFEAIIFCIRAINISYNRLTSYLEKCTQKEPIMSVVWSLIDNLYRLECLLVKTPKLKQKENWFQIFIRKLKEVEEFRHVIQHFDREIKNIFLRVQPLLGHLSWVDLSKDKKEIKLFVPCCVRLYKNLPMVNPVGKKINYRIDLVTYYLLNNEIKLSDIYYSLVKFANEFKNFIELKYDR